MEEEEDSSDVSSPPLLPIRPTPTSFFQPFLPRPLHNSSQENNNVIKPLAFSIDNILRPNFGGQGSGPESLQSFFSSPFLQSSAFMAAAAFAAAASAVASTQATPLSTNSISTMPSLSMQATPLSPTLSTTSSTSSSTTAAPSLVKKEAKPVDLSKSNLERKIDDNDLPSGIRKDEDCPPGMVRGPNGQLWPAWVFCTRYSDRPSSGEFEGYILFLKRP